MRMNVRPFSGASGSCRSIGRRRLRPSVGQSRDCWAGESRQPPVEDDGVGEHHPPPQGEVREVVGTELLRAIPTDVVPELHEQIAAVVGLLGHLLQDGTRHVGGDEQ